jgi:hypothetical protein
MARHRRGTARRPASARPEGRPPRPSPAPAWRSAASSGRSRPRIGLPILVAAGAVIVAAVVLLLGQTTGAGLPSTSPGLGATSSTPPLNPTDGAASSASAPPSAPAAPVIAGIPCDVYEKTTYHVHAHLNILFDGELQPIAADIGLREACLYWLHTHAPHGVIHVEAPAETAFTLGQFFDVWGQPLIATQVLGRAVGAGESLFVFIDRQPYAGDPREILLGDLAAIELQVGVEPLEPLPYTFPAEFQ